MDGNNGLSISDFQIGDRITHDHYGLGKVIETQDKGANSVITVDFGTDGVKRLLLRVALLKSSDGFSNRRPSWRRRCGLITRIE